MRVSIVHQRGAEQGFERAHHAALGARDIFCDGGAAKMHLVRLEAEKENGGHGRPALVQRHEKRARILADIADGGIGRAEIEAAAQGGHDAILRVREKSGTRLIDQVWTNLNRTGY